jgi:hypothetical protein
LAGQKADVYCSGRHRKSSLAESQRAERHQSENCGIGICGGLAGALTTQRDGLDSQDLDSQRKERNIVIALGL